MSRFGFWKTKEEWFDFIEGTNKEFERCLRQNGVLEYKIMAKVGNKFASSADLMKMTNFEIIKDKTTKSRNKNEVHWLTMKPKRADSR